MHVAGGHRRDTVRSAAAVGHLVAHSQGCALMPPLPRQSPTHRIRMPAS